METEFNLSEKRGKNSGIAPCLGYVFATEFCLLGFYGKPMQKFLKAGKVNWLNLKQNSQGKHSSKPQEFYSLIKEMSPEPRIDIFARKRHNGYDTFGDQVEPELQEALTLRLENKGSKDENKR